MSISRRVDPISGKIFSSGSSLEKYERELMMREMIELKMAKKMAIDEAERQIPRKPAFKIGPGVGLRDMLLAQALGAGAHALEETCGTGCFAALLEAFCSPGRAGADLDPDEIRLFDWAATTGAAKPSFCDFQKAKNAIECALLGPAALARVFSVCSFDPAGPGGEPVLWLHRFIDSGAERISKPACAQVCAKLAEIDGFCATNADGYTAMGLINAKIRVAPSKEHRIALENLFVSLADAGLDPAALAPSLDRLAASPKILHAAQTRIEQSAIGAASLAGCAKRERRL